MLHAVFIWDRISYQILRKINTWLINDEILNIYVFFRIIIKKLRFAFAEQKNNGKEGERETMWNSYIWYQSTRLIFLWGNVDLPHCTLTIHQDKEVLTWWGVHEVKETKALKAALQGSIYFGMRIWIDSMEMGLGRLRCSLGRACRDAGAEC